MPGSPGPGGEQAAAAGLGAPPQPRTAVASACFGALARSSHAPQACVGRLILPPCLEVLLYGCRGQVLAKLCWWVLKHNRCQPSPVCCRSPRRGDGISSSFGLTLPSFPVLPPSPCSLPLCWSPPALSVSDRSGARVALWCGCCICSACISQLLLRLIISVKISGAQLFTETPPPPPPF